MQSEERVYRSWFDSDLTSFAVHVGQSDLLICAEGQFQYLAEQALHSLRDDLESYLACDPQFEKTLVPHEPLPNAPPIAREMAATTRLCGVGPMAAVAGAIAQAVGLALLEASSQVIVENGGDIFLYTARPRVAAIYAGTSPLSGKLGVRISKLNQPLGLCTSSGTVGPSLSFGKADAAIILAGSAALADAAATALGNRIQSEADIALSLAYIQTIPGLLGAAVILGEQLGAWGDLELVRVGTHKEQEA